MSNEIIAISLLIGSLCGTVLFYYLGRMYLTGFIIVSVLTANIVAAKVITVFGLQITPGAFMFSSIFLATDMMAEKYGEKHAKQAVMVSFTTMCLFLFLTQMTVLLTPANFAQDFSNMLNGVLDSSPRIFISSLLAYLIWNRIDISIFSFLHRKLEGRHLWLRNNTSTMITACGSVFTFFFLAYAGTGANWVQLASVGAVIYWMAAALDTPFIYLSKIIKPIDTNLTD